MFVYVYVYVYDKIRFVGDNKVESLPVVNTAELASYDDACV